MDSGKVALVICLTVFLVVGLNAALFAYLRKGNEAGQVKLLQRAARQVRQPWQREDQALEELSRRVAALKRETPTDSHDQEDGENRRA